jgi:hyperosmotically inducible protein
MVVGGGGRRAPPTPPLRTPGRTEKENANMSGKDTAVLGIYPDYSSVESADRRENMKTLKLCLTLLTLLAVGSLVGCSGAPRKSRDVSDSIRTALDQAGLKDVSVTQDRDKGVVTLSGNVATEGAKAQAESIAKSIATGQVVADEIAVIPAGVESETKTINSDLDKGIEKNLDAALIQNKLRKGVEYDVKSGVVTLTGEVNSESKRARVEQVASTVPNVRQVVNELQVKHQKATSTP